MQQICHGRLWLGRFLLLKRSERTVDQSIQHHAARLRHDLSNGGLPVAELLGEQIDDEEEQQLPLALRTE